MPSSERGEPKFHLPELLLLITVVTGGVWLYEGPLKSSRPVQSEESRRSAALVDTRVDARLWQDPFEAVDTHIKLEGSAEKGRANKDPAAHTHSLGHVTAELADSSSPSNHVEVLVVLANGSPYAEDRESRLRQRFAVLSGLERAGYTPADSEHIRFFHWPEEELCQGRSSDQQGKASLQVHWSGSTENVKTSISVSPKNSCSPAHDQAAKHEYWRQTPVPVEWYRSEETKSNVLVLWIKDQDLGNQPTESLRTIQRMTITAFIPRRSTASFKVIGPRFSGTLQRMTPSDTILWNQYIVLYLTARINNDLLTIYSPWSTTPAQYYLIGVDPYRPPPFYSVPDANSLLRERFAGSNIEFIRTIRTDELLIDQLFNELERRGVTLECEHKNTCRHIAVISEWDTLYGRTLPGLVRKKIADGNNDKFIGFHQYSYLRGLDGEIPQAKSKNNSEPSSGDTTPSILSPKDRRQDIDRMERPEGRSQLDYIRQLTQLIHEKEENFRADCGLRKMNCPGFRAIGVLGSDVYDKLLILQALKNSFPHVIFFTTDLDARLFHPNELAWTRNLVVASHFDLMLHTPLQGTIPPFRDTYQTATFFTILRALDVLKESASLQKQSSIGNNTPLTLQPYEKAPQTFEPVPRTKLHEIGRNGPVDISMDIDLSLTAQHIEPINPIRLPPPNEDEARESVFWVIPGLLVVFVLLIPISVTICRWADTPLTIKAVGKGILVFLGLLIAACYWLIPYLVSDLYGGEPFSLFDGVSIWPSQILRTTVIALALPALWLIYHFRRRACEEMETLFPKHLPRQTPHGPSSLTKFFTQWQQMSIYGWATDEERPSKEEPCAVWKQYRERLHGVWTSSRVALWSLIFWVVGRIVLEITGMPSTPFRGQVADQVNSLLLPLAVLGMIAVIFLVLDITRLTSVFVEKLIPKELGQLLANELTTRLRIIAHLTKHIDTFIYYPAGLIALMLMARSDYIDNWDFPIGLIIVVGLSASYVIVSAFQLRWASERARRRVLDELSFLKWNKEKRGKNEDEKEIQQTIDEVKELTQGAFMPLTQLPVFRIVTLPTGFYALFTLIETLINN
jgi:hypothetical protein